MEHRTSRPSEPHRGFNVDSLFAYFERWLLGMEELHTERDRNYQDKFRLLNESSEKALMAVEKQTSIAFGANKEAISKAEDAQKSYNERSNEFRGQLEDQAARLMGKDEALSKFSTYDEKLDECKAEIIKLREAHMQAVGRKEQIAEVKQSSQWSAGQLLSTIIAVVGFGLAIIAMVIKANR